ncbi:MULTISPECIES: extensin-like domain-containing protein [unclassified Ensifer]|uniref:extensin-like domain-containing protein n=1 Tax=unclassified Ensifer TaxID=2633371 RepID=UPI00071434EC|nr:MULTISPECIES: extensin family protein [unclassified Ensifer]KQX55077.1 extensin [Ensifer sp. Root1298]KQX90107.1 extensin [Ensifer sp. Root1312]KRC25245.1 extensin [Ensifer sp. Root74]KRD67165.1 extensin [Ensifer sp. Root954]
MRRSFPLILLSLLILTGASLPKSGPIPLKKPPIEAGEKEAAPTPEEKPATLTDGGKADQPEVPTGDEQPVPQPKPKDGSEGAAKDQKPATGEKDQPADDKKEEKPAPIVYPPVEAEDAADYAKCVADLKAIGATFVEAKRIDDGKGCGIDKPLEVTSILPAVTLAPKGLMRCETALALARWTKETAQPAAEVAFDKTIKIEALNQASTYICRLRNNATTGKISEHAHGNAVDIASFTLSNGATIAIQPRDEDGTMDGAFQRAVTASACLYFKTVLDPGSDAAHETHLHLDVIERRNDYRYCR